MTTTTVNPTTVPATVPAPVVRRVTPTGRLVLPAGVDRDTWLAARRMGVGSTDAPAILGVTEPGEYERGPLHVWHDKLGQLPDEDAGEAAFWGRVHEESIARVWAERNRARVRRVGLVAHVDHDWMLTSLDRRVTACPLPEGGPCALAVQTRSVHKGPAWHEGPPRDVLTQILWQLAVTGYPHIHWAVLVGGSQPHQGVVRAADHREAIEDLAAACERFWTGHVLTLVPPPPGGCDPKALLRLYRRLHPAREGVVDLDRHPDGVDALVDYERARIEEAAAKARKEAAYARMVANLGAARTARLAGETAYSLDPASAPARTDLEQLAERWPDAYAACVTPGATERLNVAKTFRLVIGKITARATGGGS